MRVGYFYMDGVLTPQECDQIIAAGSKNMTPAQTQNGKATDEVRKGKTFFFSEGENPDLDPLFQRCVDAMIFCGNEAFGTNVAYIEPIQFTDYGKGDHYRWHYDQNGVTETEKPDRHLSASLELCDPETYEGGGLEFFGIGDDVPERKQGRIIVFSSMMCHRARKVTAGRRCSLVLWGRS